jgi:hypothetical protein
MSPDFNVIYAYDTLKLVNGDSDLKKFRSMPNAFGFEIGYFTSDQGFFHLNLWNTIARTKFIKSDYFHLISQNDLPSSGALDFEELIGDNNLYGFAHHPEFKNLPKLSKGIAWYGLSRKVVFYIKENYSDLLNSLVNEVLVTYKSNPHITEGYTGGFDEYAVGWLIDKLTVVFGRLNDCLRLCLWRGSNKAFTSEGLKVSEYGKVTSFTSPLTLLNKPKVSEFLLEGDIISARKFEYGSKDYNELYNLILSELRK